MPIIIRETGSNYTPPNIGTHLAVCFRVVDCGVQPDERYGDKEKIAISWELPMELIKTDQGDKPMSVSKTYSRSLNTKSNLYKDLTRWRGRDFTPKELEGFRLGTILGKACQLSIIHKEVNGKLVGRIDGVFAAPRGLAAPPPVNALVEYSIDQGKDTVYEKLPQWIRTMIDFGLARKAAETQPPEVTSEPETPPEEPEAGQDVLF